MNSVTQSLRSLRKSPVNASSMLLSIVASASLVVGTFAVSDALRLRPLPLTDASHLYAIGLQTQSGQSVPFSYPAYRRLAQTSSFSALYAWSGGVALAVQGADARLVRAYVWTVSGDLFEQFPIHPWLGRFIEPADQDPASLTGAQVAVLGYAFWQREFGGRPEILGQTIRIEGAPFTVIGVAPPDFRGISRTVEADVTVPLAAHPVLFPGPDYRNRGDILWVNVIARAPTSLPRDQIVARVDAVVPTILRETIPASHSGAHRERFLAMKAIVDDVATPADRYTWRRYRIPLEVLSLIALFATVIAGVNVGALATARAVSRGREFAVRLALGATVSQITRQVLLEGVVLASIGVLLSVWLGSLVSQTVGKMIVGSSADVPVALDTAANFRVVAVAVLAALCTAAVAMPIPAWLVARRVRINQNQHGEGHAGVGLRTVLVLGSIQVAVVMTLLPTVGLLTLTLHRLEEASRMIAVEDVSAAYLERQPGRSAPPPDYLHSLVRSFTATNSSTAAVVETPPGVGADATPTVSVRTTRSSEPTTAAYNAVTPGFFALLRVPLVRGRDFAWDDTKTQPVVAIVSNRLARRLFPASDPVGSRIRIGDSKSLQDVKIIGIAADIPLDARNQHGPAVYVPLMQAASDLPHPTGVLLLRGPVSKITSTVERLGYDYVTSIAGLPTLGESVFASERLAATVAQYCGFGITLLAACGVYALLTYLVAGRMREYATRMALGATPRRIVLTVARAVCAIVLAGVVVGSTGARVVARQFEPLLFGVSPSDPGVLVAAVAAITAVIAIVTMGPIRRACNAEIISLLKADQ